MPTINVTRLLSSSYIAGQPFDVIRTTAVAGELGETQVSSITAQAIGSVQPAASSDLERLPEGAMQKGAIKIRTVFRLTSGDEETKPDTIRWPAGTGARYFVQTVDDWTQFGAGYVEALATLADINP